MVLKFLSQWVTLNAFDPQPSQPNPSQAPKPVFAFMFFTFIYILQDVARFKGLYSPNLASLSNFLFWHGFTFTDSYINSDLCIILHTLAQASLLALKNALQYLYFNFHLDIPKNPKYMCTQNHNPSRVHRYTNHTQGESKCYSRRGNSPMSHRIHPSQMYIHRYQDSWMR